MTKQSKMVLKGDYYYKYVCIWNKETRTKKQIPIKLAHKDDYELAMERKDEVELFVTQLKIDGKTDKIVGYQFYWNSDNGRNKFKPPIKISEGIDMYNKSRKNSRRINTISINNCS